MNREIKFRVWDYKNKTFQTREASLSILLSLEYQGVIVSDSSAFEFQQFTGFNDSKGRNIYEGDILKISCKPYLPEIKQDAGVGDVIFLNGSFQINNQRRRDAGTRLANYSLVHSISEVSEVIGNIFENPELLT